MTTSLAAQLKKLAVPETRSILSGDLKQASFLYDEKQAATFEKQHFYNIGNCFLILSVMIFSIFLF